MDPETHAPRTRTGLHAGKASRHMATNRATIFAHGCARNRVASFPAGDSPA